MEPTGAKITAARIVVLMPNWLGDGVMATPFLRGLRGLYPEARIAAVARGMVAPVCTGLVDDVKIYGKGEERAVSRWMRGERFELGILLPNSFRSAWMLWRGGVGRRLGYARGGRSWLLTDRVGAVRRTAERRAVDGSCAEAIKNFGGGKVKVGSAFQPVPTILYYLELLRYLAGQGDSGVPGPAPLKTAGFMQLVVTAPEKLEAEAALGQLRNSEMGLMGDHFVVLVPGANFGASKCWLPERFAAVAEQLVDPGGKFGASVLIAGSPSEGPICEAIFAAVGRHKERIFILGRANDGKGVSIGTLKEIVRRSRMMICNDTGPRHIAAAFGVPLVTIFGPTNPVWAETFASNERIVRVNVPCGPCQLKRCPIDHRCMKGVTVEMVMAAVGELWQGGERQ